MTDLPEQIWLSPDDKHISFVDNRDHPVFVNDVGYIRADLVPTWQPIETAPKETEILICDINKSVFTGIFDCDGVWGSGYEFFIPQPTHWMPLPQVPSEAK